MTLARAVSDLAPSEIAALARILPELDYYQLLHLDPQASPRDVRRAYHTTCRSFHPDAHPGRDPELRAAVGEISKRVSEAYSVLRDPRRRKAYDEHLTGGGGPRMQLAEAQAAAQSQRTEQAGRTPQGRQYFSLAQGHLERGDPAAAIRDLQTALTFEPGNAAFRELLASLRKR